MDPTNKKNSYELLSMSDSDSDIPPHIPELNFKSPRRKRLRKKLPSYRHQRHYEEGQSQKCCLPFGKYMSLSLIIVILCCWLLILSWLVVIFNDELKRFDNNLMLVAAGNQGIPEALQKCHVQTKELQSNQSDLYSRVINLNSQTTAISQELAALRKKFNDSTAIFTKTPANEKDAVEKMASFKIWINQLNTSINRLNASQNRLENDFKIFMSNISASNLKEKLHTEKVPNVDTSNFATDDLKSKITKLGNNLSYINNSLISEIQLLKEEHNKDRASNALENVISLKNITSRIDVLEQEVIKMSRLSISVENLTSQFDLTNKELKILSQRVDKLMKENSTAADKPK